MNHKTNYPVQFVKNVAFTKLIKVDGRLREFNFRKRQGENGPFYHVDVSDERNNRFIFYMHPEDGRWEMKKEFLPPWITSAEASLHAAIVESE